MKRGFTGRRCPRCNGNIFIDQDNYVESETPYPGWYERCLQCGHTRYLKPAGELTKDLKVVPPAREVVKV